MIFLQVVQGGTRLEDVVCGANSLSIGSADTNTVCIEGEGIAAVHAQITTANKKLTSLVPESQVRVNGSAVESAVLTNGDTFTIGAFEFTFFHSDESYAQAHETKTWKVPSRSEPK